jgi:hypothetical protein
MVHCIGWVTLSTWSHTLALTTLTRRISGLSARLTGNISSKPFRLLQHGTQATIANFHGADAISGPPNGGAIFALASSDPVFLWIG